MTTCVVAFSEQLQSSTDEDSGWLPDRHPKLHVTGEHRSRHFPSAKTKKDAPRLRCTKQTACRAWVGKGNEGKVVEDEIKELLPGDG